MTDRKETNAPQTLEEKLQQLNRIADGILHRIESGACTPAERSQLIRNYDQIDRILSRHNATAGTEPDFSLLDQIAEEMKNEQIRSGLDGDP